MLHRRSLVSEGGCQVEHLFVFGIGGRPRHQALLCGLLSIVKQSVSLVVVSSSERAFRRAAKVCPSLLYIHVVAFSF